MVHLGKLDTTDIPGYDDGMVFTLVGVIYKLQEVLKKLSIGDDD